MSKKPYILIKDYKQKLIGVSSSYSVHYLQVSFLSKLVCVVCYMVKMEPLWKRCGVRWRKTFSCNVPAHPSMRWQLLLGRDVEWELLFVWNQLSSWVLSLCQVAPANVKSATVLFARNGERITLVHHIMWHVGTCCFPERHRAPSS